MALPAPASPGISIADGALWGEYAVKGSYVYAFAAMRVDGSRDRERAIYRINYK